MGFMSIVGFAPGVAGGGNRQFVNAVDKNLWVYAECKCDGVAVRRIYGDLHYDLFILSGHATCAYTCAYTLVVQKWPDLGAVRLNISSIGQCEVAAHSKPRRCTYILR